MAFSDLSALNWAHAGPSMAAAFLASTVEFVEALTVVLAVGTVRGWRHALAGTGLALVLLAVLVAVFGPALAKVPLDLLQLVIGSLLLLFGLRWLRKAILRSAGIIALHDETAAFEAETAVLSGTKRAAHGWDVGAIATAFQITMIEGIEVVFIVIAVGAGGGMLVPASIAALAALVMVVALGLIVHRPLSRIPENLLKFAVGILLSAFGTFWVGEGAGMAWPGDDWSLAALIAAFLCAALAAVRLARAVASPAAAIRA